MQRLVILLLIGALMVPGPAEAAKSAALRKTIVVGKAALYGLAGGLVVGLASQVVKKRAKNIFVGGSLGMYAGILTGLYIVLASDTTPKEYEGPDTYEDFSGWDSSIAPPPREAQQAFLETDKFEINLFETSF